MNPAANMIASERLIPSDAASTSCNDPAPAMMGTLIRKEKRAASSRRRPRKSPSVIVAPERETPGTSAAACASPIPTASTKRSLSARRVLRPTPSATINNTPTATRLKATTQGLRTVFSKKLSRKNPIRAAGTVEARIKYASRCCGSARSLPPGESERTNAPAIPSRSRQKKETTATRVPRCSATSNGRPKRSWLRPRKYCARSRCPELEIGRNSVSPCTTPRNTASRNSSNPQPSDPVSIQPAHYDKSQSACQHATASPPLFSTSPAGTLSTPPKASPGGSQLVSAKKS